MSSAHITSVGNDGTKRQHRWSCSRKKRAMTGGVESVIFGGGASVLSSETDRTEAAEESARRARMLHFRTRKRSPVTLRFRLRGEYTLFPVDHSRTVFSAVTKVSCNAPKFFSEATQSESHSTKKCAQSAIVFLPAKNSILVR